MKNRFVLFIGIVSLAAMSLGSLNDAQAAQKPNGSTLHATVTAPSH